MVGTEAWKWEHHLANVYLVDAFDGLPNLVPIICKDCFKNHIGMNTLTQPQNENLMGKVT